MSDSERVTSDDHGAAVPDGADRTPEVVRPDAVEEHERVDHDEIEEAVTHPAKVMRIGSMVKQLLEEVRASDLDEASRERLAEIYERSVAELSEAMSADLQEELRSLALPFDHDEVPSEAELRVAKAQLVGWLEGLFHGIQASMMAQQVAARAQMQQVRELPGAPGQPGMRPSGDEGARPGTYL